MRGERSDRQGDRRALWESAGKVGKSVHARAGETRADRDSGAEGGAEGYLGKCRLGPKSRTVSLENNRKKTRGRAIFIGEMAGGYNKAEPPAINGRGPVPSRRASDLQSIISLHLDDVDRG